MRIRPHRVRYRRPDDTDKAVACVCARCKGTLRLSASDRIHMIVLLGEIVCRSCQEKSR